MGIVIPWHCSITDLFSALYLKIVNTVSSWSRNFILKRLASCTKLCLEGGRLTILSMHSWNSSTQCLFLNSHLCIYTCRNNSMQSVALCTGCPLYTNWTHRLQLWLSSWLHWKELWDWHQRVWSQPLPEQCNLYSERCLCIKLILVITWIVPACHSSQNVLKHIWIVGMIIL